MSSLNWLLFLQHLSLAAHSPFFFFNDTATTEIYTLSLHDALPISPQTTGELSTLPRVANVHSVLPSLICKQDRKSTRLNSSHGYISYAVFCLKKKKKTKKTKCPTIISP